MGRRKRGNSGKLKPNFVMPRLVERGAGLVVRNE